MKSWSPSKCVVCAIGILFLVATIQFIGYGDVPQSINYQGKLTDSSGNPVLQTTVQMDFNIYDVLTLGKPLWSETQSVKVTNGIYNVEIGQDPVGNPFPPDLFYGKRYLEVVVNGETLKPRQPLISTPFAMIAEKAQFAEDAETLDGLDSKDFAPSDHNHPFSEITGTATDRQIPDDITIKYAANAGSADMALSAKDSDKLGGQLPSKFAPASHDHDSLYVNVTGDSISAASNGAILSVTNRGTGNGIYVSSASDDGVYVSNAGKYGIHIQSAAEHGIYATGGPDSGDYGCFCVGNSGVYGRGTDTSNTNYGGYFEASGSTGIGVYACATNTWDYTNYGGWFKALGHHGWGIYAYGKEYAGYFAGDVRVNGNLKIYSSDGATKVVELGTGLDYAEGFDVSEIVETIKPGCVLIIDPESPGKLTLSRTAYDTKVAGIVAGAKDLDSGVRLGVGKFDHDVALAGRVYCNLDAIEAGVEPGDLLTTSTTPGYAMKAENYQRAQGAILGKAMERLEKGKKGQILVLVTLQ